MIKLYFLSFFYSALNHIPPFVWAVFHVACDIIQFWMRRLMNYFRPRSRNLYHGAIQELEQCSNYEDWYNKAAIVDEITGADLWRRNFYSQRYDVNSVLEQYAVLDQALEENDAHTIIHRFSTTGPSMLRNFAGIVDKRLFTKSLIGTKLLIEQYLDKVLECLQFLCETPAMATTSFFQRCKLSLGTTAFILQGGSLFGLFHLGVIRGLLDQKLLPNIISGSSMGACIGSLCSVLTNDELFALLSGDNLLNAIKSDLELLKKCGYGNIDQDLNLGSLLQNVIHRGYSKDVFLFINFVNKVVIKDLTFEEAFQRTGKIINIIVHPTDRNRCPSLLNYVTTPNVLIASAIDCSLGSEVVSSGTKLLCKNLKNEIVEYIPDTGDSRLIFLTPQNASESGLTESPYTRLTELFNVNNFIVSLARPYLAPLVINDLKHEIKTSKYYYYKHYPTTDMSNFTPLQLSNMNEVEPLGFKFRYHLERKLKHLITMEFRHRVEVLDNLGLLSHWIKRLAIDEKTPRSATEITIVPNLKSLSFSRVIEGQLDNIPYWIKCGEQSCWPVLALIKTRCAVEFGLDEIIKAKKSF
ncbi:LADA_0B01244g1_1 [Lachancea dasiensis]|uniref:LADA_0B01244g1_1 n=1 Tax=Lachancea dasiensis TaxID=1072105 RepID=A0A1G4ISD2_9SACH|nr:LADA_0B01244g1_1 [Lachancea dasiensis]